MSSYYYNNGSPTAGGGGFARNSILSVLSATQIDNKTVLPAEIIAIILDHLPVSDLMRFARTCRRLREMVYDDTRWVARLRIMGCWNEAEARRRFEEAVIRRRRDTATAAALVRGASGFAGGPGGVGGGEKGGSTMLFDASLEERRRQQLQQLYLQQKQQQEQQQQQQLQDGFETLALTGGAASASATNPLQDPEALLRILQSVRSIRGRAREEYGKVYGALAPFYWDLARAKTHADPVVFKVFRDPERQAQMLANLAAFCRSDWSQGWRQRQERLENMIHIFEGAVLREFEQGYEFWDVDGRMHKYAGVLHVLNGSTAGIDLFIQKHPLFSDREISTCSGLDCLLLARGGTGEDAQVSLEPSRAFFARLTAKVNEQAGVINRIFPRPAGVFWNFVDKVREDIVMEYITPLLDETHERNMEAYLQATSGLFEQSLQFFQSLEAPVDPEVAGEQKDAAKAPASAAATAEAAAEERKQGIARRREQTRSMYGHLGGGGSISSLGKDEDDVIKKASGANKRKLERARKSKEMVYKTFEPHLDLYLQEELDFFTKQAEEEVQEWDTRLTAEEASVESFFMANFNRREVKKDFLSSFKKVVMMPVTVLPGLGGSSSSSSSNNNNNNTKTTTQPSTPTTPLPGSMTLPEKAPDDELAAKAAFMASRLAGIKSLFSIEVALSLVHKAKTSLGRTAVFLQLEGQAAGEAREQCSSIFVVLLRVLGNGHVKQGFDRAVQHLSQYNRGRGSQAVMVGGEKKEDEEAVPPLMTFIELVNVGDLISQMIDVFYEQQLTGPGIADRNDFLDPAGVAKKRFEQMIDESVAAGLNKGIDVLMDEVEFLCATVQKPTDYYPEAADAVAEGGLFSLNGPLASVTGMAGMTGMTGGGGTSTPRTENSSTTKLGSPGPPGSAGDSGSTATGDSGSGSGSGNKGLDDIGPTPTALRVVELVRSHTSMLQGSTEKTMLEVFNGEVGLRLFTAICKHLKRQRISMAGAVHVIADMAVYFDYVRSLHNPDLLAYFRALRELSQLYLIDARHHAKEMAIIIADGDRFGGIFRAEEVYEFAERRADWYQVKRDVERAMYGLECMLM